MLWVIYRVKAAKEDIDCMHEAVHYVEQRVKTIGEKMDLLMVHFDVRPSNEVPSAPDLGQLVDDWDNTEHVWIDGQRTSRGQTQ